MREGGKGKGRESETDEGDEGDRDYWYTTLVMVYDRRNSLDWAKHVSRFLMWTPPRPLDPLASLTPSMAPHLRG